jgi:hypothetical protein
LDTGSSVSSFEPFVLGAGTLEVAPFFAFFLVEPGVELALRLTPVAGEAILPLVAGDMSRGGGRYIESGGKRVQGVNKWSWKNV